MRIRIVISGRGYDAAASIPAELELPEGATIDDALKAIDAVLPEGRKLAASCLIAVSGTHVGTVASHPPRALGDGEELILIAPVAGG